MARTMMISNEVYEKLKKSKPEGTSFSVLIDELMRSRENPKTAHMLKRFCGVLKDDKEFEKNKKELGKKWKSWTKMYV